MPKIERVEITMLNLAPKTLREDAIQTFTCQETPLVTITDSDGVCGTGYCYTIGTGGPSVVALLEKSFAPALIGKDPERIGGIWHELLLQTHATSVGAITSLALAAVDTALWDMACKRAKLPLWKAVGGARESIPVYSTEGGWLQIETPALVEDALAKQAAGFGGAKYKVGHPHVATDAKRLAAVRDAVGDNFDIMTDANQSFSLSESIRRAKMLEEQGIAWFEEPLKADNVTAHAELARSTSVPIAVGESIYSLSQFKEYLVHGAASIIQVDVARIGGITPWLKVAALAEAHGVVVCPHFLMELHLPLVCGINNAQWLEYIPQLDLITEHGITMKDGRAYPSEEAGLGIAWDWDAIQKNASYGAEI